MTVDAGGNGNGGTISVVATDNSIALTGILSANGMGSGDGGNITINTPAAYPVDLTSLEITTEGGETGGGGNVTIANGADFDVNSLSYRLFGSMGTIYNAGLLNPLVVSRTVC